MKFIKSRNNAIGRHIGEKYLIIPINGKLNEKGCLCELNELGKFIWEYIGKSKTVKYNEILNKINEIYNVPNNYDLKQDLDNFLDNLIRLDLIDMEETN